MFANQDFYSIGMPQLNNANYITGATATRNAAPRNTTTWSVSDDLTWLRGAHTLTMGGSFSGLVNRGNTFDVVPAVTLGFDTTNDPAAGMFNTTNFPGASTANLNEARALYALLTGRVTSMANTARLNAESGKYEYSRTARTARQAERHRGVRAGLVALEADAHAQRRRPLRPAAGLHADHGHLLDDQAGRSLRHLGHGRRYRRPVLQHLHARTRRAK